MPTPTSYNFTLAQVDVGALSSLIQASSIVTSLNTISTIGTETTILFNDVLSANDQNTLNSIISSYVYVQPLNLTTPVIVQNVPIVTTQYELDDKDLKLARAMATINPSTLSATIALQIPGTFGSTDGRYVAGGYAISEDYDKDDYITVRIIDTDRLIAQAIQAAESLSTMPTDAQIQAMGTIPNFGAFPAYPVVKSYTDDDLPAANQGWYFWANAIGNNVQPNGECEVEPIGGYGFLPAGFFIVMTYVRTTLTTGSFRVNFYWGKKEQ